MLGILDVAIGMAFLFLFMSMIASALREAIEGWLQHRAQLLERGIKELLRTQTNDEAWVKAFYNHPLISSLYKGTYPGGQETVTAEADDAEGAKRKGLDAVLKRVGLRAEDTLLPSYIPKESFALAVLDLAAKASENGETLSFARLQDTLRADGAPNEVQRIIWIAMSTAACDLAKVRTSLEDWYDASMDRVSGWYTRRTTLILFLVGLGAAVVFNVDAITIGKSLITDKPLRDAVVAQAARYTTGHDEAASPQKSRSPASDKRDVPTVPQPAQGRAAEPADRALAATERDATSGTPSFDELRTELNQIGFPIGWTLRGWRLYPTPQACRGRAAGTAVAIPCDDSHYWSTLFACLLGWLITALATMLGAPFWFDLLNKLVSLRSTLKPPEDDDTKKTAAPKPVDRSRVVVT